MIICHCQSITDHDIHAAVDWMRSSDRDTVITQNRGSEHFARYRGGGAHVVLSSKRRGAVAPHPVQNVVGQHRRLGALHGPLVHTQASNLQSCQPQQADRQHDHGDQDFEQTRARLGLHRH